MFYKHHSSYLFFNNSTNILIHLQDGLQILKSHMGIGFHMGISQNKSDRKFAVT